MNLREYWKRYYSKDYKKAKLQMNFTIHPIITILRFVFGIYWLVFCLVNHETNWPWLIIYGITVGIWFFMKPVVSYFYCKHKWIGVIHKTLVYKIGSGCDIFHGYDTETDKHVRSFNNKAQEFIFTYILPPTLNALYFGVIALLFLYMPAENGYVSYNSFYAPGTKVVVQSPDGKEVGTIINEVSKTLDNYEVRLESGQTVTTGAIQREPNRLFKNPEYTIRGEIIEESYGIKGYINNVVGFVKHTYCIFRDALQWSFTHHNDGTIKTDTNIIHNIFGDIWTKEVY